MQGDPERIKHLTPESLTLRRGPELVHDPRGLAMQSDPIMRLQRVYQYAILPSCYEMPCIDVFMSCDPKNIKMILTLKRFF